MLIRCLIWGTLLVLAHSGLAQKISPWRVYQPADGLAEAACLRVQPGSRDKIWVSHPGSQRISALNGFSAHTTLLPKNAERQVFESPGGQLWVVVPAGVAEMTSSGWITHQETNIAAFKSQSASSIPLCPVRQGMVLFLLPDRLMEYGGQLSRTLYEAADTGVGEFHSMAPAKDGGLWIIGQRGIAKAAGPLRSLSSDSLWAEYSLPESLRFEEMQAFHEDSDGGFTLVADSVADSKNVVVRFSGKEWRQLPPSTNSMRFAWRGPDHEDWAAGKDSLYRLQDAIWQRVRIDECNGAEFADVAPDDAGAFWLATSKGLFRYAPPLWRSSKDVEATSHADLTEEKLPAGTRFIGQLRDGRSCIIAGNNLQLLGEKGVEPFPFPSLPPDPTDGWTKLFNSENGDLWLGSFHLVAWLHEGHWVTFNSSDQSTPDGAVDFAEFNDGTIWCATQNKIWEFNGRTWSIRRAGVDNIHCLLRSRSGGVWVGCDDGLHQFYRDAWTVNSAVEGLSIGAINDLYEDNTGHIVARGSNGESSTFHPDADRDPPVTKIEKLGDLHLLEGGSVTINFTGFDKWKYTPPVRLVFSHRLDESEWSAFGPATNLRLNDLAAGNHTLQVRAMDPNRNIDPHPARLDFSVALPWYKETRLVAISMVCALIASFFAVVAYNRHRRLLLSYAEIELKIAERTRELELAHRELLHSQKMNAMGALAAGIAHDFNNILSIIKGSVQLIEEDFDRQNVQTRLDRIKTMVAQGSGVVKAMLGFSRDNTPPRLNNVNEVVANTVKLLGDRFLREVALELECDSNLPQAIVSREFVQQILLNLIFNASEAVTENRKIIIATRIRGTLPAGTVLTPALADPLTDGNVQHNERYICLSVEDFGCGIPAENLPRIFEPFFTTKAFSTRRGTGLGLSMVYNLARKMGAGLAVESTSGRGSTFTLVLLRSSSLQSESTDKMSEVAQANQESQVQRR